MMDIFADIKPTPKLYIADVTVKFNYRPRKNSKKVEPHTVSLHQVPIVLSQGKFPTRKVEDGFMRRLFAIHGKGKFEDSGIRLVKLDNCKFSSNLSYKFNYDKH